MKKVAFFLVAALLSACGGNSDQKDLKINSLGYFETQGLNVLVFNNQYSGGFNDEKNSGIEMIHHGVRTCLLYTSRCV